MAHTHRDKKKLLTRVRRIGGQVAALERALEAEGEKLLEDIEQSRTVWHLRGLTADDGRAIVAAFPDAEVPDGWTKWVVPGYEYLAIENRRADTFSRMVDYFRENGVKLVGAVQEFTDPKTQQEYLYFPIRAL